MLSKYSSHVSEARIPSLFSGLPVSKPSQPFSTIKQEIPLCPTSFSVTGTDPDEDTLTYSWEFGDGTTSTEQSPNKTFNNSQTYNVNVNVSDSYGSQSQSSVKIIINDTVAPTTTSITYDSKLHLESEGSDYFVNGTFFDTIV